MTAGGGKRIEVAEEKGGPGSFGGTVREEAARAAELLAWYDAEKRTLPWRSLGGTPDPYAVWLSEIMLQQTNTTTAAPYFLAFLSKWPSVGDLAAAEIEDVLRAWAGLGYYARARNLHACAKAVAAAGGAFPKTAAELESLPGIGPYTAGAIASIAFSERVGALDGNFERILARLHGVRAALPKARAELRALLDKMVPEDRPGDFAQAGMDLGATLCRPKAPKCPACPWSSSCAASLGGYAEELPKKSPKPAKPTRSGVAWAPLDPKGRLLAERRPAKGLLGGMLGLFGTPWVAAAGESGGDGGGEGAETGPDDEGAPCFARWRDAGEIEHVFAHFRLRLRVRVGRTAAEKSSDAGKWIEPGEISTEAFPSVFAKAVRAALQADKESSSSQGGGPA